MTVRPKSCREYMNAKSLVITDLKYCRKEKYNPNTMIAQFCKHLLANVTSPMPSAWTTICRRRHIRLLIFWHEIDVKLLELLEKHLQFSDGWQNRHSVQKVKQNHTVPKHLARTATTHQRKSRLTNSTLWAGSQSSRNEKFKAFQGLSMILIVFFQQPKLSAWNTKFIAKPHRNKSLKQRRHKPTDTVMINSWEIDIIQPRIYMHSTSAFMKYQQCQNAAPQCEYIQYLHYVQ